MPMSAKQFRAALKRLGFSQLEAARRLGVSPRTVRYWVAKDARTRTPIPEPVAILLKTWTTQAR
ncbi:MAG TPA: helix-turn-helix domain-containing protein [Gemmatimonadales bacterium]|nr:helix-turn-helix domain-containing protein [Gemmatimonadales bacterium]